MSGWRDIATAPRDGTEIQVRIPGNGEDNVIAWQSDAFMDENGTCGGWAFTRDQEPPDCWTDGVCWAINEDECASVQPTHWKPLPSDRNQQIIAAYLAGETVTGLARTHSISRQRVNQLVRAAGCAHRKPGMAETKRLTARAG